MAVHKSILAILIKGFEAPSMKIQATVLEGRYSLLIKHLVIIKDCHQLPVDVRNDTCFGGPASMLIGRNNLFAQSYHTGCLLIGEKLPGGS